MMRTATGLRERLLDAADLLVDFATLGEYGVQRPRPPECERRPSPQGAGSSPAAIPAAEQLDSA